MTAGKLPAAVLNASFYLSLLCFISASLASLLSSSFLPVLFIFAFVGTITLIRHLKSKHMFWTKNLNTTFEHMKTEVIRQI